MRHKKKRVLQLSTGVQKKDLVVRNLLTSLVTHGELVTTVKRAKVLKSEADKLIGRMVQFWATYDEAGAKREADRLAKKVLFTEAAGKKLVGDIVPKYVNEEKISGYVMNVKLGLRPGDSAEKVLVRLI